MEQAERPPKRADWKPFYQYRRSLLYLAIALPLSDAIWAVMAAYLELRDLVVRIGWVVICIVWAGAGLVRLHSIRKWPCPKCGKSFHGSYLRWNLYGTCASCGTRARSKGD